MAKPRACGGRARTYRDEHGQSPARRQSTRPCLSVCVRVPPLRHRGILWVAVLLALGGVCRGGAADDPKKKAERVSSYVTLAETITRVGLQVGAMLEKHPYDRALCQYAKELGALHARAVARLTPPEGAEDLHAKFKDAVTEFAQAADGFASGDYSTARKHREACVRDFNRALLEVIKLRKDGVIP